MALRPYPKGYGGCILNGIGRHKVVNADRPRGVVDELHESSTLMLHCQGATVVQIHIHSRADMVAPIRAWRDGQTQATERDSIVVGYSAPVVAGKDMLRRQFLGPGAESWFRRGGLAAKALVVLGNVPGQNPIGLVQGRGAVAS